MDQISSELILMPFIDIGIYLQCLSMSHSLQIYTRATLYSKHNTSPRPATIGHTHQVNIRAIIIGRPGDHHTIALVGMYVPGVGGK